MIINTLAAAIASLGIILSCHSLVMVIKTRKRIRRLTKQINEINRSLKSK